MTPEDIEQLKQLKQLFDDGVLTAEEFAIQKNLILASPQNAELANGESQDKSAHTALNASDSPKEAFGTSGGEDKYAVMRDMLASGALEAKNLSQETLRLVYGKQDDGLSTKQQNSQSVGGSQGTSTTPGLGVADAIRALHASKEANVSGTAASSTAGAAEIVRAFKEANVSGAAASSTAGAAEIVRAFKEANVSGAAASSSGTSKTKKLVLTFTAIILVALVVVVSVIVGGSNDSAKTGDTASKDESVPPSTIFPQGTQIKLDTIGLLSPYGYGDATCVLKIGNRSIQNCSNKGLSIEIGEQVSFEVSGRGDGVSCLIFVYTSSERYMFDKDAVTGSGQPMSVRCSGILAP